jgi:hypothetical protein
MTSDPNIGLVGSREISTGESHLDRSGSSNPYVGAEHLPLIQVARVQARPPDGSSDQPSAVVLAAALAVVALLMLVLTASADPADRDVVLPGGPGPSPVDAALMVIFATAEGAVAHETQPLWAAWTESDAGGPFLYVAAATGLSPADVAAFRVAQVQADERIVTWGDQGISLEGDERNRLVPLPAGLFAYGTHGQERS